MYAVTKLLEQLSAQSWICVFGTDRQALCKVDTLSSEAYPFSAIPGNMKCTLDKANVRVETVINNHNVMIKEKLCEHTGKHGWNILTRTQTIFNCCSFCLPVSHVRVYSNNSSRHRTNTPYTYFFKIRLLFHMHWIVSKHPLLMAAKSNRLSPNETIMWFMLWVWERTLLVINTEHSHVVCCFQNYAEWFVCC